MKKQTAVDYLVEKLENTIGNSIISVMQEEVKQAKAMERERMCEFAYKCHNHYKVYGDFKIEEYYNETYGGDK
jgi:hypothetical protein